MSARFNENFSLIERRWPVVAKSLADAMQEPRAKVVNDGPQATLLVDGIHLTSSYDRDSEAAIQATLIPQESPEAWVYGIGLGDLPRRLLQRPQLKRLHVVLLNPAVARQSIEHFDHGDWLGDERVEILTAASQEATHFPFAASPACLQLADNASARLRDLVVLELATPFIRKLHSAEKPELQARLKENESFITEDPDVSELFGCFGGQTILVAAPGPTLSEHYELLRTRKSPLIAVDAALKPLTKAGIVPDVVVTIDFWGDHWGGGGVVQRLFSEANLDSCAGKGLVYFPTTHQDLLRAWPGKRFCAYTEAPLYRELRSRIPKAALFSSGSVIHPAVDLSVKMGADMVVLCGADFAYPKGKSHVAGSVYCRDVSLSGSDDWVLDGYGSRIPTAPNLRGYLRDLETYIMGQSQVLFRNAGRSGAQIQGAPHLKEGENDF